MFGTETWVLTPRMDRCLGSFQHRVAPRITGRTLRRRGGGSWEYPSIEKEMVESGLKGIGTYVTRRKNTVAQYIVTRPILDLYERAAHSLGARVSHWWSEQDRLDLEGIKKRSAAELYREEVIGQEGGIPLEMTTIRE